MSDRGPSTTLAKLLDARNERPESLAEIDRRIRRRFEKRCAVFVLDMCGFSRLSQRYGIIHFLAMIRRMQRHVLPIVAAAGGRVVKCEADNVFAVFDDVPAALRAARRLLEDLARANEQLPADWDVHVGIGIGYGDLLLIGREDLFGDEVNLASKLGEDVAGAGDVLLTAAAWGRAGRVRTTCRRHRLKVSGLDVPYYAWKPRPQR